MPERDPNDIPFNYGDDRIVLLVRDPRWAYAYWEITEKKYDETRKILGKSLPSSKEIIRIYDATEIPWKSFDIEIGGGARNWYINVPHAARSYVVEIGYLTAEGRFLPMARSNTVNMPPEGPSNVIDENWMTVDFERIYAISGGFGTGKSSGELKRSMEKHLLQQRSSGWGSSPSSPLNWRSK